MTKRRLRGALSCYAILALVAFLVLDDERFLIAVVALLGGLAVMSYTAYLREKLDGD